jgi:ethanolamine utilization protein EutP (predicted NTPase)
MAGASLSSEAIMANVSEFSIVTYLRKPGYWRAAIFPKARTVIRRDTVLSVVTPDDFASEAEAQLVAEKLIRKL